MLQGRSILSTLPTRVNAIIRYVGIRQDVQVILLVVFQYALIQMLTIFFVLNVGVIQVVMRERHVIDVDHASTVSIVVLLYFGQVRVLELLLALLLFDVCA